MDEDWRERGFGRGSEAGHRGEPGYGGYGEERMSGRGYGPYGSGRGFGESRWGEARGFGGRFGRYGGYGGYGAYEDLGYGPGMGWGEGDERWRGNEGRWGGEGRFGFGERRFGRWPEWSERYRGRDERSFGERAEQFFERAKRKLTGPKNYQRSDERIREDLCDRLANAEWIDASEVAVQVQNAEVTLTGTVRERPMKHQIEDIADAVLGVKDVHNQIRIERGLENLETQAARGTRERAPRA
jgi:hypothetical protein